MAYFKENCITIRNTQDSARLERFPLDHRLEGLQSTYDLIRRTTDRMPDKTAFHFLETAGSNSQAHDISYRQLFSRITQTANLFHDLGLRSCDVVSYLLPNLPETHYVLWGGEAAGIANPINPLLDLDHIVGIMTAARSKILVIPGPLPENDIWLKIKNIKDRVPSLEHIIQLNGTPEQGNLCYEDIIDNYPTDRLVSGRVFERDDVCSLFHTGGTTGTPKLARHSHYNELANALMASLVIDITAEDVSLCGLPLFHVNGVIVTGLACFLAGASVVIATPGGFRTPDVIPNFWTIVEKYRVSFFSGVPTIYAALLQVSIGAADVSSLRTALCGAAPMPHDLITRFEAVTGLALMEGYGLTEGTCVSCCNPLDGERRVGSIGFPLPYQDMKTVILDEEGAYLRDCATDEIGTVVIRGPNVFDGYLQEEANEGVWLANDWFNTGDMGRVDDQGYFWLTGRIKELIIRGGHNIDPAVIENALTRHEGVQAVAAVGKPDSYAGEIPVAYVVLAEGATCDSAELIAFAKSHIAERAAVPKEIYLIPELPLTAVGKIFKPSLKQDAMKRATLDALANFDLPLNISVDPDKTYGTVLTIEIESSVSPSVIEEIRDIMAHYTFQTKIKNKK